MKLNFSYKKLLFMAGLLLCMIPQSVMAQREKPKNLLLYDNQPYHFGFIIALNQMSYAFDYKEDYQNILYQFIDHPNLPQGYNPVTIERIPGAPGYFLDNDSLLFYNRSLVSVPRYGFAVGVVGNLRLGKYFDLRLIPTLSFGRKYIEYQYAVIKDDTHPEIMEMHSDRTQLLVTVMEFPLQVKFRSKRLNNVAAYIVAGGNPKLDFSFLYDNDKNRIRTKVFDFAAEIGTGFDFYNGYFKFGIEAKMSFGLINMFDAQNNQYDPSINGLHDRVFQLSLTFE